MKRITKFFAGAALVSAAAYGCHVHETMPPEAPPQISSSNKEITKQAFESAKKKMIEQGIGSQTFRDTVLVQLESGKEECRGIDPEDTKEGVPTVIEPDHTFKDNTFGLLATKTDGEVYCFETNKAIIAAEYSQDITNAFGPLAPTALKYAVRLLLGESKVANDSVQGRSNAEFTPQARALEASCWAGWVTPDAEVKDSIDVVNQRNYNPSDGLGTDAQHAEAFKQGAETKDCSTIAYTPVN